MATWTFGGYPVVNPAELRQRQQVEAKLQFTSRAFWDKANSYVNPLGMTPGRGWLLMYRRDVVALNNKNLKYANGASYLNLFSLKIDNHIVVKNALIVRATCMTPNIPADNNSLYLVEISDYRYMLCESGVLNTAYNIRLPNPCVDTRDGSSAVEFDGNSLNGSAAPWSWQGICDDLYYTMSKPSASWTSTIPLPYTPDGVPENIRFVFGNSWFALHVVLYLVGCTTQYDLANDVLSVVRMGTTQTVGTTSLESYLNNLNSSLVYDAQPIESINTRKVYPALAMPVTSNQWGTESDFARSVADSRDEFVVGYIGVNSRTVTGESSISYGDNNRNGIKISTETTGTNKTLAYAEVAGGSTRTELLFDPMQRLGRNLTETNTFTYNATQVANRVTARCENHYAEVLYSQSSMRKVFSGLIPNLLPGSNCKCVSVYDYGAGLLTDVMNGPNYVADPILSPPTTSQEYGWDASQFFALSEVLQVPDLARIKYPTDHPREIQVVYIVDGDDPGDVPSGWVVPNYGSPVYFYDGALADAPLAVGSQPYYYPASVTNNCWIVNGNNPGGVAASDALPMNKPMLAKACGWVDISGDVRPVFMVFPENVFGNFNGCATVVTGLTGVVPAGLTVSTTSVPKSHTCP